MATLSQELLRNCSRVKSTTNPLPFPRRQLPTTSAKQRGYEMLTANIDSAGSYRL